MPAFIDARFWAVASQQGIMRSLLAAALYTYALCVYQFPLPSSAQSLQFSELDYSVTEDNPSGRVLQITKTGTNNADIAVTLQYLSLQQYRDMGLSEANFDTQGLDTAEGEILLWNPSKPDTIGGQIKVS